LFVLVYAIGKIKGQMVKESFLFKKLTMFMVVFDFLFGCLSVVCVFLVLVLISCFFKWYIKIKK